MTDEKYREILKQAKADLKETRNGLSRLKSEQLRAEKRLTELLEFIVAASKMLGEEYVDEEEIGLTDAIRQVFRTVAGLGLSVTGVEKQLVKTGYDLNRYGSPASATASISKVVARLAERKEIKAAGRTPDGKTMYKPEPATEPKP